jgi:prolyl-tRNA editing enzyme YbaK/EbsC (Cys-tRNA(Pro) deacylase)
MDHEQTWGPNELRAWIARERIDAALIDGLGDTPTVPAAAAALGVETDQIIKTLLFLVERRGDNQGEQEGRQDSRQENRQAVVVISYGERRVDKGRLAAHWGVSKKRVTLAPAEVVSALLGFAAGGVPPFGHRTRLPLLIDAGILELRERYGGVVYGGGGDDHTMLRLSVDELLRVTGGDVVSLA